MAKSKKVIVNLPKDVKFEGVSFSKEFLTSHGSEAAFLEAMNQKTYSGLLEGPNRDAKLRELYALHGAKAEDVQEQPESQVQADPDLATFKGVVDGSITAEDLEAKTKKGKR